MERTHKTSELIRRFAPYFKKYRHVLFFDLFCAALTTLCELVLPLIVRYLTQTAQYNLSELSVNLILRIGLLYLILRVLDVTANYYMANKGHVMGAKIETDMRRDLFSHLQKLSFSYYSNVKIGQLMARITSDLFEITEFAHHCPEEFFIAGIKITAAFIILGFINLPLTLIIFSILPVMLVCSTLFNKKMRATFKNSRNQIGELNARVEDSLLGIRVVKSFANEGMEKEKFEAGNAEFLEIKKTNYFYMGGFQSTTRFFDGVMYLAVIVAGALFILYGQISSADFIAYLLYVTTLLTSIRRIVEFTEQFQRGMTGIERFIEVMDVPVDIKDAPNAAICRDIKGDIEFENVSFSYDDNTTKVLNGISFKATHGKSIAIVGPSGSGKTTLCSLIPRFYDVTGGRILLDGKDIREFTLESLRLNIGVVQQDTYLFSGTVFENIAYGKPGADREAILEAARLAGAHDFILSLPNGYDTYVGERGVKLSGGQKQRISIARVFLKNPPILILDEATSALDNESEKIVQESLSKLAAGRTTFTIAHRLTTVQNASTIFVLTEDGIVEQGSHEALIAKRGKYYDYYHLYHTDTI